MIAWAFFLSLADLEIAQAQTPSPPSPDAPSAPMRESGDEGDPGAAPSAPGLTTVEPERSAADQGDSSGPSFAVEASPKGSSSPEGLESALASEVRAASAAAGPSGDPDAIFRLFQVHADQEKRVRFIGALGGVALGGATIGITAALADASSISPTPLYVMGGITLGFGLLGFILPSEAERVARRYRASDSGHTDEEAAAFESVFRTLSQDAARSRKTGAIFSFALAGAGIGFGAAMLSGSFGMPEAEARAYGSIVLGSGVGLAVAGVGQLVIPTGVESAYAAWEAIRGPNTFAFSVAPTVGGAQLAWSGAF